jgi:uncharacterized protein (DUF849 family)
LVKSNAELVSKVVNIARELDMVVTSPDIAGKFLVLKKP